MITGTLRLSLKYIHRVMRYIAARQTNAHTCTCTHRGSYNIAHRSWQQATIFQRNIAIVKNFRFQETKKYQLFALRNSQDVSSQYNVQTRLVNFLPKHTFEKKKERSSVVRSSILTTMTSE